jgi:hypothetical protein
MKRLTKEEFNSAIQKGLGRAYLHVLEYGDENIRDSLQNAIVHNLVYDVQCEGGRADWLFSILNNTKHLSHYEEYLLSKLGTIEKDWDRDQAFELLYHFARNGSRSAREKLYQEFDKQQQNESWIDGEQIVELDGVKGPEVLRS